MKPVEFPQQNQVWARDQAEYLPLPAYVNTQESISCWRLTWRERLTLLLTGRLWLRQYNFSGPLQPQLPQVESPFKPAPMVLHDSLG
jgi:hypothetical protein